MREKAAYGPEGTVWVFCFFPDLFLIISVLGNDGRQMANGM